MYATVNSSNKIALTFDTKCVTACTGSHNEETSIDQLTSQLINSTNQLYNSQYSTNQTDSGAGQQSSQHPLGVEELTKLHSEPNDISPLPTSCHQQFL